MQNIEILIRLFLTRIAKYIKANFMKIWWIIFLISIGCIPFAAFDAYSARGYFAFGGEYLLPIFPLALLGFKPRKETTDENTSYQAV